jgi:hypothetical protein
MSGERTDQGRQRIDAACPFCAPSGGIITLDFEHGGILHSLPVCQSFDRMTADEFVQAVLDGKHLQ